MPKVINYKFKPHPDQKNFFESTALEILFGGSRGPGKSAALVNYIFLYCMKYPGARCILARRKLVMLMNSTFNSWRDWVPVDTYSFNMSTHVVRFYNGSEVVLTGLDSNEDLDRFSSMEVALVAIDEAQEVLEAHYISLLSRLRQKLPDGTYPPFKMLCTANPAICYLRSRFILNPIPGKRVFIQSLTQANMANLPPDYLERLKEAYKDTPILYKQMVEGNWDLSDEPNGVVQYSALEECARTTHVKAYNHLKGVSCDSARFGDDSTVIYSWEGTKIVKALIRKGMDGASVASECLAACREMKGCWIAIDTCAQMGAVSLDVIKKMLNEDKDIQLIGVNSSEDAINPKYKNTRAEMYFTAADLIHDNMCTLPNDPILFADFSYQRYEYIFDKLQLLSKNIIKQKLGRSPDRSDAAAIGLYAIAKKVIPPPPNYKGFILSRSRDIDVGTSYDQDMSSYEEDVSNDYVL